MYMNKHYWNWRKKSSWSSDRDGMFVFVGKKIVPAMGVTSRCSVTVLADRTEKLQTCLFNLLTAICPCKTAQPFLLDTSLRKTLQFSF